jgi:Tol biopolymer transport system component
MIMTEGGVLTLRDSTTAAVLANVPLPNAYATHPDWSPNGDLIAYTAFDSPASDWAIAGGRIVVQPYDVSTTTFGAARELVPAQAGMTIYYPTFSPDGKWILFNEAASANSYNEANAELYAVPVDGSVAPIKLAFADVGAGLTNSWVRWAPFTSSDGTKTMYWFTFSSKRQFGVRQQAGNPQVWMAPFYPDQAAQGLDPSGPAFHLPFQDLATSNHIAQWTTQVVPIG